MKSYAHSVEEPREWIESRSHSFHSWCPHLVSDDVTISRLPHYGLWIEAIEERWV